MVTDFCYYWNDFRSLVVQATGCDVLSPTHPIVLIWTSLVLPSIVMSIVDVKTLSPFYQILYNANVYGVYYGYQLYLWHKPIIRGLNTIRDYVMYNIEALKSVKIVKAMALNAKYEDICNICKEVMALDHTTCLLHCGHSFHSVCINKWEEIQHRVKSTAMCPSCRGEFRTNQKWPLDYCASKVVYKHGSPE
eukprot:108746_1